MANLTPIDETQHTFREDGPAEDGLPGLGDWFWVRDTWGAEKRRWLGCVVKTGSNYVGIESPRNDGSYHTIRVHIDNIDKLEPEPNADAYIASQIAAYQGEIRTLMQEVKDTYAQLGVTNPAITDQQQTSTALATLNKQVDVKQYEVALVTAKDVTLPALFDRIKKANTNLAAWMTAPTLPLMASVGPLKDQISGINDRIFNISLYAGLTEQTVLLTPDAAPAAPDAKLHVMQLRRYMDEECLLEYEAGGMEFKNIRDFDAWLIRPENRDRLLPFPRTLVAFRVRREAKERDSEGNISTLFINIQIEQADKLTFLYIRNGDQVWRMSCAMDFGELIVPEEGEFSPGEPMMMKRWADRVDGFMSRTRYEHLKAEYTEKEAKRRQWNEEHKGDAIHNPFGFLSTDLYADGRRFDPDEWSPFDPTNVLYDDAMKVIADQIKEYNRIAVIIQGLFDRSEALHPHPPVRTWTAEGFDAAITLIRDGNYVLYEGEKPDFEAYRARLNRSILVGSIVAGADDYWALAEGVKETRRMDNSWRESRRDWRPTRFRPYGNPGPGKLAIVAAWNPRAKVATFNWRRTSTSGRRYGESYPVSIKIKSDHLLNVSAYRPGDFKQFFRDPRTRREYLKWAPLLLAAEDYHAGKRSVVGSVIND
jgi:hypothetical protein